MLWELIEKRSSTKNRYLRKILSIVTRRMLDKRGSFIGDGAVFHGRPDFPHGITGIFISNQAVVGKDSVIFHQVTIGSVTIGDDPEKKGSPHIGDNCYIGAGAKIIGNIKIGNNVRIGANAVVVKDVPDNCVVVNQPVRLIQKQNLNNKMVEIRHLAK